MVSVQRGRCLTCFWPLRHHIFDYMLQRRNLLAVQLTVRIDETTNQTFQWHHVFAAISIVDTSKKINNSVSENSSKTYSHTANSWKCFNKKTYSVTLGSKLPIQSLRSSFESSTDSTFSISITKISLFYIISLFN